MQGTGKNIINSRLPYLTKRIAKNPSKHFNLDKTNSPDQLGHMQVKSAELKTHLSHYLRLVQETGEDIEVCVRETPVAYLTRTKEDPMNTALNLKTRQLEAAFQTVGLTLVAPATTPLPSNRHLPTPSVAGDGRTDLDTIQETRRQRDW